MSEVHRVCSVLNAVPAVEVVGPPQGVLAARQEGRPVRAQEARRRPERHVHDGAGRERRHPRPERLGEVDARPPALDAAPARRGRARASSATTCSPSRGRCAGSSTASRSRRASSRRCPPARTCSYAARFYGMGPRETRDKIPEILTASASRRTGAASRWRTSRAECSRRWRSRGRCSPRRCCSCSTSRRPGSTRARSSRCRSSSARCGRTHDSTILLCTHDLAEAEALADRVGILDRGELLFLEPVPAILERFRRDDARAGVLRGHRPRVRGRDRRGRRGPGGVRMMRGAAATLRAELIGLGGVVERNVYLTRRYIWWDVAFMVWTVANTLTIVFIAKGIEATGGQIDVNRDDDDAPDRRGRLGVPRDHVRVHDRDGRLGALGGDDRVHVHGAALARDAPRGRGLLRGALRADPGDHALHRRRVLLRPGDAERELPRRVRRARRRVALVHRDRR